MNSTATIKSNISNLKALNGIAKYEANQADERLTLELFNGMVITITRSPLAKYRNADSFDVWMPPSKPGMASDVAPGKSASEVYELVKRYVAAALTI